jgi:hypothetical protein
MNRLELRPVATGRRNRFTVQILIDGRDLIDLVRAIELPFATAEGHPDIAGGYSGLHLV